MNVKFPCDFSRAVYSVIACGTDLPAQKVTFPFSLIAPPRESFAGAPPGLNQLSPAWMLRENIYALKRNEAKFRARNRARRNRFDFAVFRRETVELMRAAARRLADVPVEKPFYTERDLPGIGKNVVTEYDRARAVDAYQFYIRYHALLALRDRVREALLNGGDIAPLLTNPSACGDWEQQPNWYTISESKTPLPGCASWGRWRCRSPRTASARGRRTTPAAPGSSTITRTYTRRPIATRSSGAAWDEADALHDEVEGYLKQFAGAGGPTRHPRAVPTAEGTVSHFRR